MRTTEQLAAEIAALRAQFDALTPVLTALKWKVYREGWKADADAYAAKAAEQRRIGEQIRAKRRVWIKQQSPAGAGPAPRRRGRRGW